MDDPQSREDATAATCRFLELVVRNAVDAINSRDFSLSSPKWAGFSRHFRMESHAGGFQNALDPVQQMLPARPLHEMGFGDFLEHQRNLADACPGYSVRIVDLHTIEVNEHRGYAEVMLASDTMGIPEGMVRPSIGTFKFRRSMGKWECMATKTIPGAPMPGE